MFDEFFIIGIDDKDIESLELDDAEHTYLPPKTLFMFNDKQAKAFCERRKVVKDFCFPDGIELSKVKNAGQSI